MKLTRRALGKNITAGVGASLLAPVFPPEAAFAEDFQDVASGGWRQVLPGVWSVRIGRPEKITPVSSRLIPPASAAVGRLPVVATSSIGTPKARIGARGTILELPLAANEELYGFGLQFFSLKQRGKKRLIKVNADPPKDTGESHAPVPFYVSSLGYGILVDTLRYATFYCGSAHPKPTQPAPLDAKPTAQDGQSQVLVDVPLAQGVDVYLFAGPTMLDVVRRYNLFSGGGLIPPEWGLGFWYRTEGSATDADILALSKEFRERNIPCSVLGLEPGWHTHSYSCTYDWNRTRFADPPSFIKSLRASNFQVNLWEHAFIHPASPLFSPMANLSGDMAVWGGLVPDFQDPKARETFGDYHGKQLIDLGVTGFKLDECDNSDYTGGWSFPEDSRFPSGVDGEQMHGLIGLRYQETLWKQFRDRKLPTYGLVRSSGALATPYPFVLYSDLYDHRQFIRGLVTAGFSGLLWCPEVRDAQSEEDLIRRLQSVIFSPLAMINGWYIKNPPWKQLDRKRNNAGDLNVGWQALEQRCREIIGWRMQLLPYLQAAFARYALDGTPPFRALVLDWPHEASVASVDDAWMVGDRMLVAPLFAGEPGRKLALPPGDWYDFWSGTHHAGGTTLDLPASTRNIPVFVKGGTVLPLATVTNSTGDDARRKLSVQVYGSGEIPFDLTLPTGERVNCSWNPASSTGEITSHGWVPAFTAVEWKHHAY